MVRRVDSPIALSRVRGLPIDSSRLPVASASQDKLREIQAITGLEVVQANHTNVPEIQGLEWLPVAEAKAREAYERNGQPVLIEETSFEIHDFQGLQGEPFPGALVKQVLGSRKQREMYAREAINLAAVSGHPPRATARTVFGAWDGQEFAFREGLVQGEIVMPRGDFQFGFDDMFVPDGQDKLPTWDPVVGKRTFAEMKLEEKNQLSARAVALKKMKDDPITLETRIFMMNEPSKIETDLARPEELQDRKAVEFAFAADAFRGNEPNGKFEAPNFAAYHAITYTGDVIRVVPEPDSNDLGLITSPLDTRRGLNNRRRLQSNDDVTPVYFEPGPLQRKRILEARADEFKRYHLDKDNTRPEATEPIAYEILRGMRDGKIERVPKANRRCEAIDDLLVVLKDQDPIYVNSSTRDAETELANAVQILSAATFRDAGYTRRLAEGRRSRKKNADYGLFLDPQGNGKPGSFFRMGYMPQGSFKDALVTSALSFTDCGISRNSLFVDPKRRLALFIDVKKALEQMELPQDIFELCLSKVGIAVGVESSEETLKEIEMFVNAGCTKFRFYSTCNDERCVTVPEETRQRFGDAVSLLYMPIIDLEHAFKLIKPNIRIDEMGVGHGGGENCDSLGAGGAYTGLSLLYQLYLQKEFNDVAVGIEGGGSGVLAVAPLLDFVSKDRQVFGGTIECGGLYVLDSNGNLVQPYHGSASVFTQLIESALYPEKAATRLTRGGNVRNNEGVGNYSKAQLAEMSMVQRLQTLRMFAGLMLADNGANSIYDLRRQVIERGFDNIVMVSDLAAYTAAPHPG